jgi:hypothetical protein
MSISTLRSSEKNGLVEETSATYRKGKINLNKVNFNISYSEFYLVEDRKKSLGKYEFDENNKVLKYERTDFDNRNQRIVTFFNKFEYAHDLVTRESIRIWEYVGQGSVEQDSIVYLDSVIYQLDPIEKGYKHSNLSDPGVYTNYILNDENNVVRKTTYFPGFNEEVVYTYDSNKQLVKIENTLTNEDVSSSGSTQSVTTRTELHYSIDGLISEAMFYDEKNEMLEKKIFNYK